jgi:hypothetical protein
MPRNILINLLETYPKSDWDFYEVCKNPNVYFKYFQENLMTKCLIIKGQREIYMWEGISENPNTTPDIVKSHPYFWCLDHLCLNSSTTLESIMPKITKKKLKKTPFFSKYQPEHFWKLLSNRLPWKTIQENPHLPWVWNVIYKAPFEFVKANLDKDWDWKLISRYSVTWQDVQEHPTLPWNYDFMSGNENITLEIIKANPNIPWNYDFMSGNVNLTIEFVLENLDKDWDVFGLSLNPAFTLEIIKANPSIKWNMQGLCLNPILPFEFFHRTDKNLLDFQSISQNEFNYHPYFQSNVYIKKMTKKFHDTIYHELLAKTHASMNNM